MSDTPLSDRRTVLKSLGAASFVAVAGCSSSGGSEGDDGTPDDGTPDGGPTPDGEAELAYTWEDATWDSYWYSLYNMSTTISLAGNGVRFPHNDQQRQAFEQRLPAILEHADTDRPPIRNPYLTMAAFTEGDPGFTQEPVLEADDGRPDGSTLRWDPGASSQVVSPSSLAWTHLKGVTWAKNFEKHADILPASIAAKFRAQVLATLAQIGVNVALVQGGPEGNGALTKGERMELVSEFRPGPAAYGEDTRFTPPEPGYPDRTARPHHHAAMLWFLSDLNSLAQNGWFGYVNPEPLVPAENIQQLTDAMGRATMDLFAPADVVSAGSTRAAGEMLGAVGWYGTHAGSDDLRSRAAAYANALGSEVESHVEGNGRVADGASNQAATQGVVAQGLAWASQIDGVDHTGTAAEVVGYLSEELFDEDAGTFASQPDADTYLITARDAGDITGGINAADAVLGMDRKDQYARFFDQTLNRGRLQRAERPSSRDEDAEHTLPLPPEAGGEFGQAAVYNAAVEYDTAADEWRVADDGFDTAASLYLSNQEVWISQWGGEFYSGRGVPGETDSPE